MKAKHALNLNATSIFLTICVITLTGNLLLAAKIWKLWPLTISIFFASVKIYTALNSILNQLTS
jgi:hypothetical protein